MAPVWFSSSFILLDLPLVDVGYAVFMWLTNVSCGLKLSNPFWTSTVQPIDTLREPDLFLPKPACLSTQIGMAKQNSSSWTQHRWDKAIMMMIMMMEFNWLTSIKQNGSRRAKQAQTCYWWKSWMRPMDPTADTQTPLYSNFYVLHRSCRL